MSRGVRLLGALLAALLVGMAQADPGVALGPPMTIPPGADSASTVLPINGAVIFSCSPVVGPAFGPGVFGLSCRTTGEANLDPSVVFRAHSFEFENDGNPQLRWQMLLNDTGMCLGCQPEQPAPYPTDRLTLRGDFGISGCIYARQLGGDSKWAIGVCPGFGTGDDLVFMKFKDGAWSPGTVNVNGTQVPLRLAY